MKMLLQQQQQQQERHDCRGCCCCRRRRCLCCALLLWHLLAAGWPAPSIDGARSNNNIRGQRWLLFLNTHTHTRTPVQLFSLCKKWRYRYKCIYTVVRICTHTHRRIHTHTQVHTFARFTANAHSIRSHGRSISSWARAIHSQRQHNTSKHQNLIIS